MMKEQAICWHAPDIGDLTLLSATYVEHRFSRHAHSGYVIGVIDRGVEAFDYRGSLHRAVAGQVVVINPDEVHTGHSGDRHGWSYRMLYPAAEILQALATEMAQRPVARPFFDQPVIDDPALANRLGQLHALLAQSSDRLARQDRFARVMSDLIRRHAVHQPPSAVVKRHPAAVHKTIELIHARLADNISLDRLAREVGLSPFYLSRLFRRHTGLPPHAYQKQLRIDHARRLLRRKVPIAQVAAQIGFADQSHLTRQFKQLLGVTPGQFIAS